jgi:regulatory protein
MSIGIKEIHETGIDRRARLLLFDNGEDMRTAATVVKALDIEVGSEYPGIAELRELVNAAEAQQARERALRLLNARDRSAHELRTRLSQDGYSARVVDALVARYIEVGLIDDARYTESFVNSALAARKGWRRICRELERRGIATADVTPPKPDDELQRALSVIERLPVSTGKERERALRRLVTKGYAYEVAKRAIEQQGGESP